MTGSWKRRQARARHWLSRASSAEEMLLFYLELLELQEPIYRRTLASDEQVRRPDELPVAPLLPRFRKFLRDVAPAATQVLADVARSLGASSDEVLSALLESFLRQRPLGESGLEAVRAEFYPRAFLQPVAEALREKGTVHEVREADSCPWCGWPPQVGLVRDEPEVKGRRLLVCSLCAGEWPCRRAWCPRCGETDPEKLVYHVSETVPHVRLDECVTCRGYLKTVDLRKDGRAEPLVEDLVSVELDLWSGERGLRKIRCNLLGF